MKNHKMSASWYQTLNISQTAHHDGLIFAHIYVFDKLSPASEFSYDVYDFFNYIISLISYSKVLLGCYIGTHV